MEKYNNISRKICKNVVQQEVQRKVRNNYTAPFIKRFALKKLVQFLY